MSSKMPAAYDANGNLITIEMAEQGQYKKPLHCEYCPTAVSFVNGYPKQIGDDIVSVEPFFRLNKGQAHGEDCRYNVIKQIAIIARESENDVLAAIGNNQFELRLLAVKKALDQLRLAAEQKKKPDQNKSTKAAVNKVYLHAGETLGAYINSAKRVLKVRSACLSHAEIEDTLQLVFDGVRIPWNDFYFEDEDYFRCYNQLRISTVQFPVAVYGTVKEIKQVNGKKEPFAVLNFATPNRKTDRPDVLDSVSVSVWSPDLNAFDDYRADQTIIAFGMWKWKMPEEAANKKPNSSVKTFVNHTIRLWLVTRSQLCHA